MKKELLPSNTTVVKLRGLLREARRKVPPKEAICISLTIWHYGSNVDRDGVVETIGVYQSRTGKGTLHFKTIEEARKYIKGWKEEEDANTTS